MALELLMAVAKGMSEESLMEELRFMRFLKTENRCVDSKESKSGSKIAE